jgi:membrane protease YdiL (CAAX protease family)
MSTKWSGRSVVFTVEKAERKCYTVLDIKWESVGEWIVGVIVAVITLFPVCNLMAGLPVFGPAMAYAALAAVAEECFFRGFLFTALQKRGRFTAAAASSLAFSLLHFVNLVSNPLGYTLLQVAAAFSLGLALSGLLWKTKRLWPCILCHLLCNLTGHTALSPVSLWLTILCVICYAVFGIGLLRKKDEVLL